MKSKAIELIDKAHSEDPNLENNQPAELLYSNRMVEWLYKVKPNASDLHELAARCQHFYRWKIARSEYPMDKKGYHQWRIFLYKYQAEEAAKVLKEAGYDETATDFVKQMVSKKDLRKSEDTQLIEDTACLVFLEYYLAPFASTKDYSEEKWIKIIQKTWNKMSDKAHELALTIDYHPAHLELIKKAIS